ncbi:MAG: flavin reductase family protein [Lachnospiraceae bacterium]|nr:flavin reductase family protein [Lachnospiraceae bacterium]
MAKLSFKPGNMLYPVPAVMISVRGKSGEDNIITVAWAGTICSDPPMVSISVRPERHSYELIKESGEFVINLITRELVFATDYCGVKSGRDVDKFKEMNLSRQKAQIVKAPLIEESPVNLECRVTEVKELGAHHMFLAEIVAVNVDDKYMDETNKFHLEQADLVAYSHGSYYALGDLLGTFGFSVRKK